jgi:hypothetical protein
MELSFLRIGPHLLNKIVNGEISKIDCETDSTVESNDFIEHEIYNGREFTFDLAYDEKSKAMRKVVLYVESWKKESRFGGANRYTYQLKLKNQAIV